MPKEDNLIPIKPGEKLAAKPDHRKRSASIEIKVTTAEKESLTAQANEAGEKSLSSWVRGKLGI